MKTSIFKKAAELIKQGNVKISLDGDKRIFFDIEKGKQEGETDKEGVSFFYDEAGKPYLNHSCTCKHMVMTHPTNLCSHKIAAIYELVKRELENENK